MSTKDLPVVIEVRDKNFEVVINQGENHGIKLGDEFLVFGLGDRLVDPATGDDLGKLEILRGRGVVQVCQENLATIRSTMSKSTKVTFNPRRPREVGRTEIREDPLPFKLPTCGDFVRKAPSVAETILRRWSTLFFSD